MEPKFEACDDSKIAAAASQCPEQIHVVLLAGPDHLTFGGDDVGSDQIVDRHAEFPCGPAKAAAKRESRDARS
jgi:hypothetical protein